MSVREQINAAAVVNIMTRLASEDDSVARLADRTGIDPVTLGGELDGTAELTFYNAIMIADDLGTTPPALLGEVSR